MAQRNLKVKESACAHTQQTHTLMPDYEPAADGRGQLQRTGRTKRRRAACHACCCDAISQLLWRQDRILENTTMSAHLCLDGLHQPSFRNVHVQRQHLTPRQ